MKKVLFLMLIIALAVGTSFAAHTLSTTLNYSNYGIYTAAAGQFIELDETSGYIWVACGGTFNPDVCYVFSTTGAEASFSPISTGLSSLGVVTGFRQTSGIAIDRSTTPHIAYVVSDLNANGEGHYISKFVAGTGLALNGLDTASGIPLEFNRYGDIQFDSAGHLFIVQKVGTMVYALNKSNGRSLSVAAGIDTSIFTGGNGTVRRGLGVSQDGNTVYLANESNDHIMKLVGTSSGLNGTSQVTYTMSTFVDYNTVYGALSTSSNPSACDVDGAGNVYISVTGLGGNDTTVQDRVDIYNAAGALQETITMTSIYGQNMFALDSAGFNPRGVAFSSSDLSSNTLWIARFQTIFNDYAWQSASGPVAVFKPALAVDAWKEYSF